MAVQLIKTSKDFVDVSLSFEPSAITGDLTVLRNERAINNAIKNIIYMYPLEVPFQRDIGSRVGDYLFDLIDEGTAGLLTLEIKRTIRYNEPRVDIQDVVVTPRPDQNEFSCRVDYKIVGYEQVFRIEEILTPTR
tara:strand:+ start:1045 stop:1449 length:405 start_codon:yes stop_codon:yes gene_type:complete